MKPWRLFAFAALTGNLGATVVHAEPGLRQDPFERPARAAKPASKAGRDSEPRQQEWQPSLRAVILDGNRSLVNVDGTILGIGEFVGGYRLVSVRERVAVFRHDGALIEFRVDKDSPR